MGYAMVDIAVGNKGVAGGVQLVAGQLTLDKEPRSTWKLNYAHTCSLLILLYLAVTNSATYIPISVHSPSVFGLELGQAAM